MRRILGRCLIGASVALGVLALQAVPAGQSQVGLLRVAASTPFELRDWDNQINRMARDGALRIRQVRDDTMIPGRTHERLDQSYKGVRVFGGDVARQMDGLRAVSVFGTLYTGIDLDPVPGLSAEEARALMEQQAGTEMGADRLPELVILPKDEEGYVLSYRGQILSRGELTMYFIDARTGEVVWKYNNVQTQAAVGTGTGVLGDTKKISVRGQAGTFVADDQLRPPALFTYDMRGDFGKTINFLNGVVSLGTGDLASDSDNIWTDVANVDAHVYQGWTYDYFFKRFGRRGLDNNNIRILGMTHTVKREDVFTAPGEILGLFYVNAFYCSDCGPEGNGAMVYGEGLPNNVRLRVGQTLVSVNYFAGALDVVAHELTHGVTNFSAQLACCNEPGALNEAFSDIMGTSVEFFFRTPGTGPGKADYVMGQDIFIPPAPGLNRSLENPAAFGNPDHYSKRFLGKADRGGVHTNSTIASHAFYLAIEGGTNRTSGASVQGVGAANREQVEKAFYRGFVFLLPSTATFSVARAATIQAARDLYGAGSNVERAVTQAWAAVGVN